MRSLPAHLFCIAAALTLAACGGGRFNTPLATGYYASSPEQCVPYARKVSGVQLYGDAYTWWDQAETKYPRGNIPAPGAVLVLSDTPRMTHGHVAVVKRLVSEREIDVTQSNWGSDTRNRRKIYEFMRAQDVSLNNDWSQVRFWNFEANAFGFPYAARGFIYR